MFLSWLNIHITYTCFTLKAITLLKTTVDTIVDMANENVNIGMVPFLTVCSFKFCYHNSILTPFLSMYNSKYKKCSRVDGSLVLVDENKMCQGALRKCLDASCICLLPTFPSNGETDSDCLQCKKYLSTREHFWTGPHSASAGKISPSFW
jgi:hypothetical protein